MSPSHSLVKETTPEKLAEKIKEADSEVLEEIIQTKNSSPVGATPTPTSPGPTTSKPNQQQHPLSITATSIQQIPPFKPRKSKEWAPVEVRNELSTYSY